MSEDPTPYQHEERAPDTSGKSLGDIARSAFHKSGADIGTPQGWDIGFEAAAQAVRLHVLEEAAKVGDWVWTDDDDDCSEDPKPTG